MKNLELSQKFKTLRNHLGLTQKQMADALGISTVYVSYVENGTRLPSRKLLKKAYALLGKKNPPVDVLELLKASKNTHLPMQAERSNTVYQLQANGLYALAKLQRLLKKEPDRLIYILGLYHLYQEQGKFSEADQIILNAIPLMKNAEDRKWLEAYHFQLEGTSQGYQRAFEIMGEALALFEAHHPNPDQEHKEKKAELLFRTALIHFDYGYHLFQNMSELNAETLGQIKNQFEAALDKHHQLQAVYLYPFSQLDFANIHFWLGLVCLYQRYLTQGSQKPELSELKKQELLHWQCFISASKSAQIYDFQQRIPEQSHIAYFSEEYLLTNLSFLALAYARMALLEPSFTKQKALLDEGEWHLSRHRGKIRDTDTRYRYYYNLGHFYSIKAEILCQDDPCDADINCCITHIEQALSIALETDRSSLQEDLQLPLEYLYYRSTRKKEFATILGGRL